MTRLEMINYNTILTEKLQRTSDYHPEELINMNILWKKKNYLPIEAK